jgi:hypothetical protein
MAKRLQVDAGEFAIIIFSINVEPKIGWRLR